MVNLARVKRYGESKLHRNKTNKADSSLIVEFCQKENPPLWTPISEDIKHLRALMRRLDDLQKTYQQERNQLRHPNYVKPDLLATKPNEF